MNLLTLTTALATSMSINMAQMPQQSVEMKVPESRPAITNLQKGLRAHTNAVSRGAGVTPGMSINGTRAVGEQPEGRLVDQQYRSGEIYYMFFGAPTYTKIDGDVGKYVVDETNNKIWIYRMSARGTYSWVEGDIKGDEVIVRTPQCVGAASTETGDNLNIYLINMSLEKMGEGETDSPDDEVYTFVENTSDSEIKYSWDGNVLELKEGIPSYAFWEADLDKEGAEQWMWMGYSEMQQKFEPCPYTAQTPPETIEWTDYVNFSETYDVPGQHIGTIIKIGYDGDDLWIRDLHPLLPDYYVKGTKQPDGTYLFKTQFLGLNTTVGYFIFFRPGYYEEDQNGWKSLGVSDEIRLNYNAGTKEFTVPENNDLWYIQAGKGELSYLQVNITPRLYPYVTPLSPAEPSAPVDLAYTEGYPEYNQPAQLSMILPQTDVDGNWINTENLSYSLYIDGELYIFDREIYPYLEKESMSAIPYSFFDCYDFYSTGLSHSVSIYVPVEKKIGVCINNTVNGQTVSSVIAETEVAGLATSVSDKGEPLVTEWYNLSGMRVSCPENGIFIRVSRYADGSVTTGKEAR